MKLTDYILLSLSVVCFIIGIHQTFLHGFWASYWIFMLMIILLCLVQMRKKKPETGEINPKSPKKKKSASRYQDFMKF